jgi:hypothetical protein
MAAGQPARRILAAKNLIAAAVADGRLSPESALKWARRAARGEDISYISQLASYRPAQISAASQGQLMQQIVDALTALVPGAADPDDVDPEYLGLFPPQPGALPQPRQSLYYEQGNPAAHPVDDPSYPSPDTSWDGYTRASAATGDAEITDDEAFTLFPPRTEAEERKQAATRAAMTQARAAAAGSDEEPYDRLFGD